MAPVVVLSLIFVLSLMGTGKMIPATEAVWLTIPSSGTKCVSEAIQNNVTVLADYYVVNETQSGHNPLISIRLTSPYGNNLHHNENVTHGRFAFTTTEAGNFVACFWVDSNHQGTGTTLSLDWRIGIAAEDWESVTRKEKIGLRPLDTLERIGLGSLGTFFDKFSTYQKEYWDSVAGKENIGTLFDKISIYKKKYWDSVAGKENIEVVELHLRRLEAEVQAIHDKLIYLKNREAEMREVSEVTNSRVAWCSAMFIGVCIVASVFQLWYLRCFFQKMKLI